MPEPSDAELERLAKIAKGLAAQGEEHFDCVYVICGKGDRIFTGLGGCYFGAHQILQLQAGHDELSCAGEDEGDGDDGEDWKNKSKKDG